MDNRLPTGEEPQLGSHVISPRRGFMHHGIYVGDGRVVHYAGLARGSFRGRIEEVPLAQFACGRSVSTRTSSSRTFDPRQVVRRARARVGENRYRILRNNCEHFCEWCLRGESRSYQVERLLASRSALGMVLGIISVAAAYRGWFDGGRSQDRLARSQAIEVSNDIDIVVDRRRYFERPRRDAYLVVGEVWR